MEPTRTVEEPVISGLGAPTRWQWSQLLEEWDEEQLSHLVWHGVPESIRSEASFEKIQIGYITTTCSCDGVA